MARYVTLDINAHNDVRVITGPAERFGNRVGLVSVVPREYGRLVTHFPILFRKNSHSGQFEPGVLLGFAVDENLFLEGDTWLAPYVPLELQRHPFSLSGQDLVIDIDSPRVQKAEGERLFLAAGHRSDYLENVRSIMRELYEGAATAHAYGQKMAALDLIEPLRIEIEFHDGSQTTLQSLYTVCQEKLDALPAEQLADLRDAGYLQLAYFQIASLGNLSDLVTRKNNRLRN